MPLVSYYSTAIFNQLKSEIPMTLQVAMKGNGGIVLAGDLRWSLPLQLRGEYWKEGKNGRESTKFKIDCDRGIAIACAGDMGTAGHIAVEALKMGDAAAVNPIPSLKEIAKRLKAWERNDAECLMVVNGERPRLFSFSTMRTVIRRNQPIREWSPDGRQEMAFASAGDSQNAALFWVEKYYDKRIKIQQLVPFAAHIIHCAEKFNPAWIRGLEMVVCDSSGIRYLPENVIEQLMQRAEELDQSIGSLFRGYQETWPNL